MNNGDFDIAIIGGGPAGSTAAIYLARLGFSVCLIEQRQFPREVLCGEFLSREVLEILCDLGLESQFFQLQPNPISAFRFCPEHPKTFSASLPFTGYGMRRGAFDALLMENAKKAGATVFQPAKAEQIRKNGTAYEITIGNPTTEKTICARYVVAAYGKNNTMDKRVRAAAPNNSSRLNGIKFHVPVQYLVNYPVNEIQIFTSSLLYCGVNVVNDGTAAICFLEQRTKADVHPRERLGRLMKTNHHFRNIVRPEFASAAGSFPIYGTSNIFFGRKNVVDNGIFMIGDAARVIAPLAGDGIGMAMQSGKIIAEIFAEGKKNALHDNDLFDRYTVRWHAEFRRRLWIARGVQELLLSHTGRKISTAVLSKFPKILSSVIEYTRG